MIDQRPVYQLFRPRPPVLLYHILDKSVDKKVAIDPSLFRDQMEVLAEHGYRACSLQEYWEAAGKQDEGDNRLFLITFDDAYADCIEIAAPILEKVGFRAVTFVITDAIGRSNSWNPKATYKRRHMSWSELREWLSAGFEIGSHGCGHRSMVKLDAEEVRLDCVDSKAHLEDQLGVAVNAFAYPYGDFCSATATEARKHYQMGFSVYPGSNSDVAWSMRIPRVPIGPKHHRGRIHVAAELSLWTLYCDAK